jgi:hypothetical protein
VAHESHERSERIRASSDRALGFVFAAVFLLIAAWPLWSGGAWRHWALVLSGLFTAVAWIVPALLAPLNRLWMALGTLLHRLMSPVVLVFIFFVVVTPLGLLMRALGKNPLRLRLDRQATSYWIARKPPGPKPETFTDQF